MLANLPKPLKSSSKLSCCSVFCLIRNRLTDIGTTKKLFFFVPLRLKNQPKRARLPYAHGLSLDKLSFFNCEASFINMTRIFYSENGYCQDSFGFHSARHGSPRSSGKAACISSRRLPADMQAEPSRHGLR